jgi:hypothetical protein
MSLILSLAWALIALGWLALLIVALVLLGRR